MKRRSKLIAIDELTELTIEKHTHYMLGGCIVKCPDCDNCLEMLRKRCKIETIKPSHLVG